MREEPLPPFRQRTGLAAIVALLLLTQPAPANAAADLPYLFQGLKDPTFNRAFAALFKNKKDLAPWLRRYLENRDGVDTPGRAIDASGTPYELYALYEPHNCGGNFIYVLFSSLGGRGWALFTKDGGNYRFFGTPDPQQRALLTAAARE